MKKQWHTMFPGVNNFVFLGGAGSGKSELSINFAPPPGRGAREARPLL